jgi:large subunit ribosomal protein L30
MAKTDTQYIKVTLTGSVIGRIEPQKRTAKAMGLRRINDSIVVPDNAPVRGMVRAISHLVKVEAAEAPVKRTKAADKRKAAASAAVKPVAAKPVAKPKAEVASEPEAPRNDATTTTKPVEKKTAAAKPAVKKAATAAKPAAAKAPAAKKATTPKKESK